MSSDTAGHHATCEGQLAQRTAGLLPDLAVMPGMQRRAVTAPAVRDRPCPLCRAATGEPCQPKPEGEHLARYLDAYTAGQLTRAYMALALAELVVIDTCAVITIPVQPSSATCHYCGRDGQQLKPCCEHHPDDLVCADTAGCRDYLLERLKDDER